MIENLLPAAIGLAVGMVVGTLGGGGGILTVPILVYLLGAAPYDAATASLVIVGATSLVALGGHARGGNVRWAVGAVFGLVGAGWAFLGSRLSATLDPAVLMTAFAGLLAVAAALMLRKALRRPAAVGPTVADDEHRRSRATTALLVVGLATVTGLLTGFFGVGGGFVVVPALVLALRLPMRHAVGTSLLVIVLNSLTGLAGRLGSLGNVDWPMVATFAAASMVGGLVGARLSGRASVVRLTTAFAVLLAVVAVATAAQAVPDLLS